MMEGVDVQPAVGLLSGVRVLDFTRHLSGPYATMLLADLGADVIKVESLNGDPQRTLAPHREGLSVLFASLNRNKRSICVDMRSPKIGSLLRRLVEQSDVLIHNYRPGVLDEIGLSFDEARKLNDRIVYAALTGYGLTGPRKDLPAYDLSIQALTGGMSVTGHPQSSPVRAGIPIADLCGGMATSLGVTSALARREQTGAVYLDCSLFDVQISMLGYWAGIYLNTGEVPGPQGSGNTNIMPYGAVRAADGYFVIAPYRERFWLNLCAAIGREDLLADDRFKSNDARLAHRQELQEILDAEFSKSTISYWIDLLERFDIPCAPVQSIDQAMDDEQVMARNLRVATMRDGTKWEFAGSAIKTIPDTPTPNLPPPLLGEHTSEILTNVAGLSEDELAALVADGAVR